MSAEGYKPMQEEERRPSNTSVGLNDVSTALAIGRQKEKEDKKREIEELLERDNVRHFTGFCFTSGGVIHPNSYFARKWAIYSFFLVLYCTIMVPWDFCFMTKERGLGLFVMDMLMDASFLLDFMMKFITAYHDEEEQKLVQTIPAIAWNYAFSRSIIIDFPPSLPLDMIALVFPGAKQYYILKLVRVLRLMKLFHYSGVAGLATKFQLMFDIPAPILRLVKTICMLIYAAHLVACFWFRVYANQGYSGWMEQIFDPLDESLPLEEQDLSNVWDPHDKKDNAAMWLAYTTSLYWALTTLTTVGYGDICPTTQEERTFTMIIFVVGILGFGYFTGNITNIIAELMLHEHQMSEKLDEVNNYLMYRRVPKSLYKQIFQHFQYYWQKTPFSAEREIMSRLTPQLFDAMCTHLSKEVLLSNPLFTTSGNLFMIDVLVILKPVCKLPGEYVTITGEQAIDMFFLRQGKLEVQDHKTKKFLYMMRAPSSFGEGGLFGGIRRATTIATDICDLFSLSGYEFKDALDKLPDHGLRVKELVAIDRELKTQNRRKAMTLQGNNQPNFDLTADGNTMLIVYKAATKIQVLWLNKKIEQYEQRKQDLVDAGKDIDREGMQAMSYQQELKQALSKIDQVNKQILANMEIGVPIMQGSSASTGKSGDNKSLASGNELKQLDLKMETVDSKVNNIDRKVLSLEKKVEDINEKVGQALQLIQDSLSNGNGPRMRKGNNSFPKPPKVK